MIRTRNANEALLEFRKARTSYEERIKPRIADIRKLYAAWNQKEVVDESLEAHIRVHVVNCLLAALNWRLNASPEDGLPNLLPEAPIRSTRAKSVRFFDYLGLESGDNSPLLIVETKRPSTSLPYFPSLNRAEIVSYGLRGKSLSSDWDKWLRDLKDYAISAEERTGKAPKRVVMTNGDWLIAFLDPADAFLDEGTANPSKILVFEDRNDLEARFGELYVNLEHRKVVGGLPSVTPPEIGFHITKDMVDRVTHGLRATYIESMGIYQPFPLIKVAPVLLIKLVVSAWLEVQRPPQDYTIPNQMSLLDQHLQEVHNAGTSLLNEINHRLGATFQPSDLLTHYRDPEAFEQVHGVTDLGGTFLLVTGKQCHYLLRSPVAHICPHHDWSFCRTRAVETSATPISGPSVSPRAFFGAQEPYHCAHREVACIKATEVNGTNRELCGVRSAQNGGAFCEIFSFEQYLCCRMCVFEAACATAPAFKLPCEVSGDDCPL